MVDYDKKQNIEPVPEIGHFYHAFDDGKITPSRHMLMKVVDVIDYNFLPPWLKACILQEKEEHYWLFDGYTDFVIKCEYQTIYKTSHTDYYFARTKQGGWFAMTVHSWMDGCTLDVTCKDWNYLITEWKTNVLSPDKEEEFEQFIKENTITDEGTEIFTLR